MKLTESMLRTIIKEELKKALNEGDVVDINANLSPEQTKEREINDLKAFIDSLANNQELKAIVQKPKPTSNAVKKEFADKLAELVQADDSMSEIFTKYNIKRFYVAQEFGGKSSINLKGPANELFKKLLGKGGEAESTPVDNTSVLSFKPKLQESKRRRL